MQIREISLAGFLGISPDRPLRLERLGRCNVFVGPNNSGKSIVFRYLTALRRDVFANPYSPFPTSQKSVFPKRLSWRDEGAVTSEIAISLADPDLSIFGGGGLDEVWFVKNDELRFEIGITWQQDVARWTVMPKVFTQGSWHRAGAVVENRVDWGAGVSNRIGSKEKVEFERSIQAGLKNVFQAVSREMYFFDPVRALDRAGKRGVEDGSKVLAELRKWSDTTEESSTWAAFEEEMTSALNELFSASGVPTIDRFEMKEQNIMVLYFAHARTSPVEITNMGSGMEQLIILLAALLRKKSVHQVIFMEEPEVHMHPGLFRRLMRFIRKPEFNEVQFFISSHSSAVLEGASEADGVWQFRQDSKDGGCHAAPCKDFVEQHELLDALGLSGGALLQANRVIWVEGPSDRLYVREWLTLVSSREGWDLQEGSDYNFVFYGGSILSHHAIDPEGAVVEDLVSMLNVNRRSAVLMDKDLAPAEDLNKLLTRKVRELDGAEKDPKRRFARITDGREIENDLPLELLVEAVAEILKIDRSKLKGFELQGAERYPHEIVDHLDLTEEEAKTARERLSDKVGLARKVLAAAKRLESSLTPPGYAEDLAKFVRDSRLDTA